MILTIFGFVLWIIARWQLGTSFSLAPRAKHLVTSGLYKKLRHPVYYFSILALFGLSLVINDLIVYIAVGCLVGLEFFRIKEEEKILIKHFGKEYQAYKKQSWF